MRSGGVSEETVGPEQQARLRVLQRLVEAFNRQDADAAAALFAEDGVWEASRGPDVWGRRFSGEVELREGMARRFRSLPDGHYRDDTHFVCGDRGFSEWTFSATVEGKTIEVRGCDIWTFEGDKIARKNSFWKIVEP
jgi:ketosteroid isomerase-like protein